MKASALEFIIFGIFDLGVFERTLYTQFFLVYLEVRRDIRDGTRFDGLSVLEFMNFRVFEYSPISKASEWKEDWQVFKTGQRVFAVL